jgi:hypothetical protein
VLVSALLPALKFLPLPCVAAILVNVSYRMLDPPELRRILRLDPGQFLVVLVVATVSVVDEPTASAPLPRGVGGPGNEIANSALTRGIYT